MACEIGTCTSRDLTKILARKLPQTRTWCEIDAWESQVDIRNGPCWFLISNPFKRGTSSLKSLVSISSRGKLGGCNCSKLYMKNPFYFHAIQHQSTTNHVRPTFLKTCHHSHSIKSNQLHRVEYANFTWETSWNASSFCKTHLRPPSNRT